MLNKFVEIDSRIRNYRVVESKYVNNTRKAILLRNIKRMAFCKSVKAYMKIYFKINSSASTSSIGFSRFRSPETRLSAT